MNRSAKNNQPLIVLATLALAVGILLTLSAQGFAATYIGEAKARTIALNHAKLSESEVRMIHVKRYDKRGIELYDVEFLSKDAKYSYEINAISGEITAFYRNERHGDGQNTGSQTGNYIGNERAKAIAFEHAKVTESGVYKFELELKEKRRRMVYEVEFKHNGMEYEYEIDAVTGAVLRWKAERD